MIIIGADYHPSFQQIAFVRRLRHAQGSHRSRRGRHHSSTRTDRTGSIKAVEYPPTSQFARCHALIPTVNSSEQPGNSTARCGQTDANHHDQAKSKDKCLINCGSNRG